MYSELHCFLLQVDILQDPQPSLVVQNNAEERKEMDTSVRGYGELLNIR
jgi:hypothetical protein